MRGHPSDMSSIAQTSPTTPGGFRSARHVNLRAFLAGSAATTALIAGAIVVFAALATYVAFNGLPGGGDAGDSDATVFVGSSVPGAPEAAVAGASAPDAVAAAPAAPTAAAPVPSAASSLPAAPGTALVDPPTGGETSTETGEGTATVEPPAPPAQASEQRGPLSSAVDGIDDAAAGLGLDTRLADTAGPLAETLDETVAGTLNQVGGLLGNPRLGDQASQGIGATADGLLGEGGLTDRLLSR